jgi:hypothetical protein
LAGAAPRPDEIKPVETPLKGTLDFVVDSSKGSALERFAGERELEMTVLRSGGAETGPLPKSGRRGALPLTHPAAE